jgi:HEAT repeat protein
MDTPTSQAQANGPSISLEECLSQLAAGTFAFGQLASFSDLSREKARTVEAAWPRIDAATRQRLIAEAIDLADENVQFRFDRLCRLALHDEDAEIRRLAVTGLWEDETRSLLDEMIGIARDDDSIDVRAAAIALLGDALVRLSDDEPEPDLVERIGNLVLACASDDREPAIVRRRAVEAVGALEQDDWTRETILDAYQHGDATLEAGALVAMGRSLESRWRTIVRAALTSEDPELRFESARALGMIGTSDDVAELSELTLEEDTDVRQAAIAALGEIGGPGAVRVLRNLSRQAHDGDDDVINDALDAAQLGSDPLRSRQ